MNRNPLLLDRKRAALVVVDIQKKILAAVEQSELIVKNAVKLIQGAKILQLPIFVSEQNTKGLGETVAPIKEALEEVEIQEKLSFSCCGIERFTRMLRSEKVDQVILCGIESHVCVWQTAMDLINEDFYVLVVRDCVSSRKTMDCETSLNRMISQGVGVTTTEMVLFELLERADAEEFKEISKLIK